MGAKKMGENTKKAAGNAKKAESAAQKQAADDAKRSQAEEEQWSKGAKANAKKEAAAEKAAEAERKKQEKAALLAAEEASLPSKPKGAGTRTAAKKHSAAPSRGLDLSQLEAEPDSKASALSASGIDNALDLLSVTGSGPGEKIDRHPERRFKAAFAAFEERRLEEMKDEKGLRRQQKIDQIRKEFEKSPENPFNQDLIGRYDMSKDEAGNLKDQKKAATEARLTSQP